MTQIVLSILANAGGVGKTTLAVHLAYEISKRGFKVALLDLDPQRSLDVFCGLQAKSEEETILKVLAKDFDGDWPLSPVWSTNSCEVCQGHPAIADMANDLVVRSRGEYTLADRLESYPLPHQLVIIDCPATLGMLTVNALAACTHMIVPVQMEMKAIAGSAQLVSWCVTTGEELRLKPRPPILGFVPSMYDDTVAMHRQYMQEIPEITRSLGLKLYPKIRKSNEFKNASAFGEPLQMHRPKHPAGGDFQEIVRDLAALIKGSK